MNSRRRALTPDQSTLIDVILTRRSVSPKRLKGPAPSNDEIRLMVAAALTAPDHGALRPCRFISVADGAREILADIFVDAKRQRDPAASQSLLDRQREKALNAPALLVVCGRIVQGNPLIPPREQLASIGASIQNILLTAHALGYGAILLSGETTRDPIIRSAFGLSKDEEIIGFITIGKIALPPPARPRPDANEFLTTWYGP